MSEKKNIDRLFQEKFKDFEENPPGFIWDNIREELEEKKKRRVIPIWMRLSGVAAILVMGLLTGLYFINNDGTKSNPVVIDKNANHQQGTPLKTLPTDKTSGNDINSDKVYDRSDRPIVNGQMVVDADKESTGSNPDNASGNKKTATGSTKNGHNEPSVNASYNKNAVVYNSKNNKVNTTGKTGYASQSGNAVVNSTVKNSGVATTSNKNTGFNTTNKQNSAVANNQSGIAKNNAGVSGNNKTNINKEAEKANNAVANNTTSSGNNTLGRAQNNNKVTPDNLTQKNNAVANNPTALKNNTSGNNGNTTDGNSKNNTAVATTGTNKEGAAQNNTIMSNPVTGNVTPATVNKDVPLTETAIAAIDTVKPENELEMLLREKEAGKKEEKDKALADNAKTNKWNVKPQLAPVFYNSLSQGSPIDGQFAGNAKSYENDLSYGVGVNYAVSKRITIRSGVNTLNLNYQTQGVEFYASLNKSTANVGARTNANIVVQNQGTNNFTPNAFSENQLPAGTFNGSMLQKTGYVEVPVEMAYALLDKKFGIDIIGGVSTLFLNGNNVSVVSTQGYATNVGQAQNLNNIHFSTNVGVGFKYRFFKSFEANFEPMFKYQVNTFSRDSGNFKPYFIGLYSGISFSF